MRKSQTLWLVTIFSITLILLLSGCSAGSSSPTTSPSPAGQPGPTATKSTAPTIPHTTVGRDDCLVCHGSFVMWPQPASHKGKTNDTCQGCHQPMEGGPPKIDHPIDGRSKCDACHSAGALVALPESHNHRTVSECLMCHEESSASPTLIDHSIEGHEACSVCHGQGLWYPCQRTTTIVLTRCV